MIEGPALRALAADAVRRAARRAPTRLPPAHDAPGAHASGRHDTPAGGRDVGVRARHRPPTRDGMADDDLRPGDGDVAVEQHPPDEPAAHALRHLPRSRAAAQSARRSVSAATATRRSAAVSAASARAISRSPACPSTATASTARIGRRAAGSCRSAPCGHPGSPHYADQRIAWSEQRLLPMHYAWDAVMADAAEHNDWNRTITPLPRPAARQAGQGE